MAKPNLSEGFLKLVKFGNRFYQSGTKAFCRPFYIENEQVGLIPPIMFTHIKKYPKIFRVDKDHTTDTGERISLSPDLVTFEERSNQVAGVLNALRSENDLITLKQWRDEDYAINSKCTGKTLLKMERSATCLFGVHQYGVHINGYTHHSAEGLCIWVGKRSLTKPTWPGKLDQVAAGGLAHGSGIMECAWKEAKEEASIADELLKNLKPVGTCSYYYEDERGLFPECQYVMDLEVPEDFTPVNADGEMGSFQLMTIDEVKEKLITDEFKFNCAMINLDFLIRHGLITPDQEPNYTYLIENLHSSFPY